MKKSDIALIVESENSKSAKMKALYEGGMEIGDIASTLGVSYAFVYNVIQKHVRKTGGKVRISRKRKSIKKKVIALMDQGMTTKEIAKEIGTSYNYVYKIRSDYEKEHGKVEVKAPVSEAVSVPADGVKYKRVLLKLSGESLAGKKGSGLDFDRINSICKGIKKAYDAGVEIGIVVGGGNFWRGRSSGTMDRTRADHIGMLATAMNALAIADVLESMGIDVRVQTSIFMTQIAEPYIRNRAIRHLEKRRVVIFGCGTGSPFFSTDTASSLRAAEIEANVMLKATMVDGVYDKDPHKHDDAVKYDTLKLDDVLTHHLGVMDSTAAAMCADNAIPIIVFSIEDPDNIYKACMGENVGTLVEK